jgi:hypothetical protein
VDKLASNALGAALSLILGATAVLKGVAAWRAEHHSWFEAYLCAAAFAEILVIVVLWRWVKAGSWIVVSICVVGSVIAMLVPHTHCGCAGDVVLDRSTHALLAGTTGILACLRLLAVRNTNSGLARREHLGLAGKG